MNLTDAERAGRMKAYVLDLTSTAIKGLRGRIGPGARGIGDTQAAVWLGGTQYPLRNGNRIVAHITEIWHAQLFRITIGSTVTL